MKMTNQSIEPTVSVWCPAYNHEKYIVACIEGFLMQKTTFSIEIIIHDDCSTDSTPDIINAYQVKHPDKIRTIMQSENQFSKDNLHLIKSMFKSVRGKYIALCEGDDYWTDPYKLQKQVDFLENNPDYSICFHDINILKENVLVDEFLINRAYKDFYTIEDFLKGNFIFTPSVMYRSNPQALFMIENIKESVIGDYIIHIAFASFGKIKRINEKMGVYRFGSGMWSTHEENDKKRKIMFNTNRMVAFALNDNYFFLDTWYKTIIEKHNQITLDKNLLKNDFEKYLSQLFDNDNLAKRISFVAVFKILLLKVKNKIKL